jgi:pimeloyl-ACP methyl ester carboxylesterase
MRAHLLHERPFRRIALCDAVVLAPWVTETTRHIQAHIDVYRTMPAHIFEEVAAAHLRTAVHRPLDADALDAYMRPWSGERGQAAYLHKVEHFDEADTKEFEVRLRDVSVPVRILWGENDAWLARPTADRIRALVPHAELTFIRNAGHFAMEDAPDEVVNELLEFFGR